jgi:hypothetical protein
MRELIFGIPCPRPKPSPACPEPELSLAYPKPDPCPACAVCANSPLTSTGPKSWIQLLEKFYCLVMLAIEFLVDVLLTISDVLRSHMKMGQALPPAYDDLP